MKAKKYWGLYKQLPKELQNLLASDELVENLESICEKNDITQYLYEMNDYAGNVLLGLLSPDKFEETIKKELKLEKEKAKNITKEINRYVFYPVKSLLEDLYNIEIASIAKRKIQPSVSKKKIKETGEEKEGEEQEQEQGEKDKKEKSIKEDTYREPIK